MMNLVKFIPSYNDRYRKQISKYLAYIEKQCIRAVNKYIPDNPELQKENDSLELNNRILDKLEKNDYQALKNFKGKSRFTTWLTTLISYELVDMVRERRGRKPKTDEETVNTMVQTSTPGSISESTPENRLLEQEKHKIFNRAVNTIIKGLTGEEVMILKMRYPSDGSAGMRGEDIAKRLNLTRKAVYRRLDRIIIKCRKILEENKIDTSSLFEGKDQNFSDKVL